MRPISLQIAGLQSFRSKQVIDFNSLCGGGVFGIFGPTGSGKSSILDAITLALYGKVERAAGGTQGILNHAEDSLSVSFTFELGGKEAGLRYKIERNYKRSGDHTIRTTTCRLMEREGDSWTVTADKERDVTQQVQQLLGLTIEDFTRAVVLPQGKFAEFLSLKGAERRQMLQRLFQLEKYGDRLNQKLKKRVEEAKSKMEHLSAEQAGLGEASAEALQEAEAAWELAKADVNAKRAQAQEQEQNYEKNKQIWQAQVQLQELKQEASSLQEQVGRVQSLEQKLQKARAADLIKPYGDEAEKAQQHMKLTVKKEADLNQETRTVKKVLDETETRYAQAKKVREEQEPLLISKKEKLAAAIEMETERTAKEKDATKIEQALSQQKQLFLTVGQQQKSAEELLRKAIHRQNELQKQLKETSLSSEEREKVNVASELALNLEYQSKQLKEADAALKHAEEQLQRGEQEEQQISGRKKQMEDKILSMSNRLFALFNQLSELQYIQEALSHSAEAYEEQLDAKKEKDQAKRLAYQLSEQLSDGKPCIVCGSPEHPNPLTHFEVDEGLEEKLQEIKSIRKESFLLEKDMLMMKSNMEGLSEQLHQYLDGKEAAAGSAASAAEAGSLTESLPEMREQLQAAVSSVKGLRQDLVEISQETKKVSGQYQELMSQQHTLKAQLAGLRAEKQEFKEKCEKLKNEWQLQEQNWREKFPELLVEKVKEEKERVRTLDAEREKIEAGLLKAVPFIEEKEQLIEKSRIESSNIEKNITKLDTEQSALRRDIQQLHEKIQRIAGDEDPKVQRLQIEKRYNSLITEVKQWEEKRNRVLEEYHAKDKEWRSILHAKNESEQRQKEASAAWEEKRAGSPFASMAELKNSLADEQEQKAWKAEIEGYYDQTKRNEAEQKKALQFLDGQSLSQQQWEELIHSLNTIKEQLQVSLERMGETGQFFKNLQVRHVRYKELEKEKSGVEDDLKTLSKLQSVFRGNSFVEYVAEEQLIQVSRDASNRLSQLTRGRYAIEVDSSNGFVIRDDANGGVKRPVSTLSGGETFLTSLALALSLSTQIQLRGKYPLEFFFLDEGFGTLDQDLLDTVVTALEKLHTNSLSVGIISHVPELKARLTKKLIVTPSDAIGNGSRVAIENQ